MKQRLTRQDVGFTQVKNEILTDKTLSLQAKGLFAYLYSKPDDWDFSAERIATEMKECTRTIKTILKELENTGYLTRTRLKTGRVLYHISWKPQCKSCTVGTEPQCKSCTVQNLHRAELAPISNTEQSIQTNSISNTNPATQSVAVGKALELFKVVNPSYERMFSNKTERAAVTRLLSKYGEAKLSSMVAAASEAMSDRYAPKITTPYALEKDLAKLIAWYKNRTSKTAVTFV